jgi:predicted transposase/invertase (TIGR01784 family)
LCDFEGKDKQTVVNTILLRLKELSNESEYPNFLKILNVYSTNRNLENEVEKGVQMLTVDIEKTPFYKIGERKGIEKGIERGLEKGAIIIAKQMLKLGLDKEIISKATNLPIEKINEIQKELM